MHAIDIGRDLPPDLRKALKKPLAEMRKHVAEIAKRRDALRGLVSDIEDILESCDDGVQSFEYGIDALSRDL
jgi:uncharacterized membrane protein